MIELLLWRHGFEKINTNGATRHFKTFRVITNFAGWLISRNDDIIKWRPILSDFTIKNQYSKSYLFINKNDNLIWRGVFLTEKSEVSNRDWFVAKYKSMYGANDIRSSQNSWDCYSISTNMFVLKKIIFRAYLYSKIKITILTPA